MKTIEIFDPPMCCSTGVCGPETDPELVRFAADLAWVNSRGVVVQRYNPTQQPAAFAGNPMILDIIRSEGNDVLPLVVVDGCVVSRGVLPQRLQLAAWAGLQDEAGIYSSAVEELVALGASIAANCEPCFKAHFERARTLGVSVDDIAKAVQTARTVKEAPAKMMLDLATRFVERDRRRDAPAANESPCGCTAVDPADSGKCC